MPFWAFLGGSAMKYCATIGITFMKEDKLKRIQNRDIRFIKKKSRI